MRLLTIALTTALLSIALALPAFAVEEASGLSLAERIESLDTQLGRLAQRSDDWSGSLRYRWQAESRSAGLVRDNRLSQQVELKLGWQQRLSEELTLGLRMSATARDGSGFNYDPFFALGASARPYSTPQVELDRAFLTYSPDWAGSY